MSVNANHRLMVELSMQESEFTRGIGFASAALDKFRLDLKKMAKEAQASSASVQTSMTKMAASAKAQVASSTATAAAAKRSAAAASAAAQASTTGFSKVLALADKNKVAWNQTANRIGIAGGLMVGTFAAVAVGFARFEQALDQATAVIDVSIYDMERLSEAAVEAGRTTQFSAVEAAQGIEALAKAGVTATEIYGGALAGAINLAAAGGIELSEAAESAAIMMIQFGKAGKDVPHIADLLAAAAGKAVGDVHDLMMALKQGGLIASQFGLTIEDTASTLALFAQNGLLGSDAGTSLKIMLLRLAAPATRAQKAMDKLGIDVWNANGAFIGMESFAGQLQEKLGGLTEVERNHALSVIFGTDAMRSAAIMLKEGAKGYRQMAEAVNDDGFAWEVMSKRMDNLAGDVKRLKGAWDSLVISAGGGSNSALRTMTQGLTGIVNAIGRMDPGSLNAMLQFILAAGGSGLALAALMKLTIGINNFRKAVATSDGLFGKFLGQMKGAPGVLIGVSLAIAAIGVAAGIADRNLKNAIGTSEVLIANLKEIAELRNLGGFEKDLQTALSADTFASPMAAGINDLGAAFQKYRQYLNDGFTRMTVDLNPFKDDAAKAVEFFKQYDEQLAALVSSGHMEQATQAFKVMSDAMLAQGFSAEEIAKANPLLFNSMVNYANMLDVGKLTTEEYVGMMRGEFPAAVSIAISHQNDLNGTFDRTGVAALDAATKVREAVNQMATDLSKALKKIQTEDDFEAAIDDTKAAIKAKINEVDSKGRLTKAAREYRNEIKRLNRLGRVDAEDAAGREIRGGARSLAATGMALLEQDAPELNAGQVQKRIKAINTEIAAYAKAAGLGKEATADLIEQIGLVPEMVVTTFDAPGLDVTKQQAQDLETAIKAVPDLAEVRILAKNMRPTKEQVDDFVESLGEIPEEKESIIRTIAELGGVEAAQTAWATLKDKDIKVTAVAQGVDRVQAQINRITGKTVFVKVKRLRVNGGPEFEAASGGQVPGWSPTPYADNIPAMLTAREFVQPVATVDYYGEAFMEKLRKRMIPRSFIQHLAEGGSVRPTTQYVREPLRVTPERTVVERGRGDTNFSFPGARIGATPSEMMGAFGFMVNAAMAAGGIDG